jgi:hypothetical protein
MRLYASYSKTSMKAYDSLRREVLYNIVTWVGYTHETSYA